MQQIISSFNSTLNSSNTNSVRRLGINSNHWYVVARSNEVNKTPISVKVWHQSIVLYRDSTGKVVALEDRCPHRQVK
ncbi:MAG: Rieske 2Fe-2S domain-containing protein, partial [Sphaerospermopsis sp. SIO1G2]|nr:Rieske 2Fe-2S domain-containing protein [Sphaerospermopsis sp. SIO1G2]